MRGYVTALTEDAPVSMKQCSRSCEHEKSGALAKKRDSRKSSDLEIAATKSFLGNDMPRDELSQSCQGWFLFLVLNLGSDFWKSEG